MARLKAVDVGDLQIKKLTYKGDTLNRLFPLIGVWKIGVPYIKMSTKRKKGLGVVWKQYGNGVWYPRYKHFRRKRFYPLRGGMGRGS